MKLNKEFSFEHSKYSPIKECSVTKTLSYVTCVCSLHGIQREVELKEFDRTIIGIIFSYAVEQCYNEEHVA